MQKVLFPIVFGALSVLFALFITEAAVRLVVDDGMQFDLEMWKYARDVKVVSDDPLIGHEHGPNRRTKLMGVELATNSQGLRDREIPIERTSGVRRIVLVGDSLTLGWGVAAEETFAKRLERLFAADGRQVEVVNTGVGNWNTVQEVRYFLTKGAAYKPDIVVLGFFVNDAELAQPARQPSFLMRHCYACIFVLGRIDSVKRRFLGGQTWDEYYLGLFGNGDTPGWLAAKDAIRQLADYCKTNGIRLIIANLPELHDVKNYRFDEITRLVADTARENGVDFVDLLPSLRQEESSSLWVTAPDPHPNGRANELIAKGLYDTLKVLP
ncbi:MAG: SGNH/GDSL hydrolase family protein [Parvibaculaceae bacterium]